MTTMRAVRALLAGVGIALVAAPASATTTDIYYHNDLAGTPLAATDANGNLLWRQGYKPYGERLDPKAPAEQQPWFTGKAHVEAAGLSYYGARWYDPQLGRFMGVDPKGFDEANVHSFNRYAYANNNPYRFVDPDGRQAAAVFPVVAGALIVGGGFRAATPEQQRAIVDGLDKVGEYSMIGRLGWLLGHLIMNESGNASGVGVDASSGPGKGRAGEKDSSTPTGRRGSPMDVSPGSNSPETIGGRDYSGHALDRMQGRGVPPSAVEEAIRGGQTSDGTSKGTKVHTGPDGVTVVTGDRGQVVTVITK